LKKTAKGVKNYVQELGELELQFYDCRQKIHKALDLIRAHRSDRELNRAGMAIPGHSGAVSVVNNGSPGKTAEKSGRKNEKTDTMTVTLQLFEQGKTIDEIAAERSLTLPTIQRHLAHWIENGTISVSRLVTNFLKKNTTTVPSILPSPITGGWPSRSQIRKKDPPEVYIIQYNFDRT